MMIEVVLTPSGWSPAEQRPSWGSGQTPSHKRESPCAARQTSLETKAVNLEKPRVLLLTATFDLIYKLIWTAEALINYPNRLFTAYMYIWNRLTGAHMRDSPRLSSLLLLESTDRSVLLPFKRSSSPFIRNEPLPASRGQQSHSQRSLLPFQNISVRTEGRSVTRVKALQKYHCSFQSRGS